MAAAVAFPLVDAGAVSEMAPSDRLACVLSSHIDALNDLQRNLAKMETRVVHVEERRRLAGGYGKAAYGAKPPPEAPQPDACPDWTAFLAQMVERNRHVAGMALVYAEGSGGERQPSVSAGIPLPDARAAAAANSAFYAGEDPGVLELGNHAFVVKTREEVGDFLLVHLLAAGAAEELDPLWGYPNRRPRASSSLSPKGDTTGGRVASMPLKDFRRRVCGLLDSYLGSQDADDAVLSVMDLAKDMADFSDEFVVHALQTALERPIPQRDLIAALLYRLNAEGVLDSGAFNRGFAKILCTWEELALDDGPHAPAALVGLLLGCIRAGCIEEVFLTRLPEGLLSAGMSARPEDGLAALPDMQATLGRVVEKLQQYKRGLLEEGLLEPKTVTSLAQADGSGAALRRLGMPEFHHEYVKRLFSASLDWPAAVRKSCCLKSLSGLLADDVITAEDVQWGVVRLLGSLEDLSLDCPSVEAVVTQLVKDLLAEELLAPTFVKRLRSLRVGGGKGLGVLTAVLDGGGTSGQAADNDLETEDRQDLAAAFLGGSPTAPAGEKMPRSPDEGSAGAYLCAMQHWVLAVVYEAGMDASIAKRVCVGTAEYLTDEGQ